MKTAFSNWNQRIAPVFDTAQFLSLVEAAGGQITGESSHDLTAMALGHKIDWLLQQGVGTLVCGAVSRLLQEQLEAAGIQVISFVAGDLEEVRQAYFAGTLDRAVFRMPGCCGRRRRSCAGQGHARQNTL